MSDFFERLRKFRYDLHIKTEALQRGISEAKMHRKEPYLEEPQDFVDDRGIYISREDERILARLHNLRTEVQRKLDELHEGDD